MEMTIYRKKVAHTVLYDAEDHDLVSKYSWCIDDKGYVTAYAKGEITKKPNLKLHRLILGLVNPKEKGDHENGHRWDNRRQNLRKCTQAENGRNRGVQSNNTSSFKGVSWNKVKNKWSSYIKFERKRYPIGYFETPEDAARAYNFKALELFGEFAWFNDVIPRFPENGLQVRACRSDCRSGFAGVTFDKRRNRWFARVSENGKYVHLGYHETAIEAATIRDKKYFEIHGLSNRLNFPEKFNSLNNG